MKTAEGRGYAKNTKLAFEIINGEFEETNIITVLSSINVPNVSAKTLKKYKRIVGPVIEAVAKEKFLESIR